MRLGYRSSGTVERQHDTKAVGRQKIALAPLCPRPRQFSESHDDLLVIGGLPPEGRILMSGGAGEVLAVVEGMEDFADRRSSFGAAGREIALKPLSHGVAASRVFLRSRRSAPLSRWSRLNPEELGSSAGEPNRHVSAKSRSCAIG
jgi:hypothetical protein